MTRYMLSPCCDASVVVPVEVTAHLLVRGGGSVSTSIADRLADIRRQALSMEYDANEAHCAACGAAVELPS